MWLTRIADTTNTLAPVVTFALFTIISKVKNDQALLTTQAFTSLAVLSLIGTPLMMLLQTIPGMMSAMASFTRIQEFLASECRKDNRICLLDSANITSSSPPIFLEERTSSDVELTELKPTPYGNVRDHAAISVIDGTFSWKNSSQIILEDINIAIAKGSLTMVVGPVGCGKSTLLKSFLGETRVSKGFVYVSSREMSFCDQTPWLYNATVRQNIIGVSDFDPLWYETVVNACGLRKDMEDLPYGDETALGSKGIAVSGGQKQRIVRLIV
jgi:ABC-type bacteriocin/lantibiotic exporter with double-glycine peptidase domain